MVITSISEWRKGKSLISLNDEPGFLLYAKEIRAYDLHEGEELSPEKYQAILNDILIKRAKSRTLHILDRRDKTEKELRDRLRDDMYPEEAVDAAVEAAKKGRFLDDGRYAAQYIYEKSRTKSRRMIETELAGKGIAKELIDEAYAEFTELTCDGDEPDREEELILKLIKKRCPDPGSLDKTARDKLYRYLTGKGFEFPKVKRILEQYLE
ncbi:MAG: recombination regulator RecX [Lachnospiraceae bacterium]|nr:recombination regulator RecX [Lachnospiraceae bacterium]